MPRACAIRIDRDRACQATRPVLVDRSACPGRYSCILQVTDVSSATGSGRIAFMKLLLFLCVALVACKSDPARSVTDVVFICEHGAAKSVIASEYFNKLAAERGLAVRAIARGAVPQADLSVSTV